jgi:transcriptional regulator with XRE-family HTH domain
MATRELVPIARHLRELRGAAGLSQQALAVAAGLSLSVVAQIEQGTKADPRISTVVALARALGVNVDRLTAGGPAAPGKKAGAAPRKPRGRREER